MINFRPATPDDAAALAAIYAPYVATNAVSFESEAPTVAQMRDRIRKGDGLYPWIVAMAEGSDVALGYAFAKPFRASPSYRFTVETAVYVAGDLEGQGFRKQLLNSLVATLTAQDFTQAVCTLMIPNDKLIQLYESCGFRRAGQWREVCFKNAQWADIGLWQRSLAEPNTPPGEPKPFHATGIIRN